MRSRNAPLVRLSGKQGDYLGEYVAAVFFRVIGRTFLAPNESGISCLPRK